MKAYYDSAFDFPEARKILLGHYKVASEKVLGLEEHPECVSAAGALLSYLYETQLRELPHIEKIEYVSENEYMSLDFNTRKNLELVASGREQKKREACYGSLTGPKLPWVHENSKVGYPGL